MKNQDTPISAGSAAALTARITATLGPLDADEQACCEKLEELGRKLAEIQEQVHDAEENLRIIKGAKVDAIRSLMSDDPLLAQAFGAGGGGASGGEEVPVAVVADDEPGEVVEAVEQDDEDAGEGGSPLLKMDD